MLFSKNCRKFGFLPSLSQIWKSPLADLIKLPCLACAPNCLSFHEGVLYTKKRTNMLWSAGKLKKKIEIYSKRSVSELSITIKSVNGVKTWHVN